MNTHYIYFHIGDFLGETLDFDTLEIGAYWLLIIAHYKTGEAGLPDCDASFCKITRLKKSKWLKIKDRVLSKFVKNGSFFEHKTVQNLIKKRTKKEQNANANLLKSLHSAKTVGRHTNNQLTNNQLTNNQDIKIKIKKQKDLLARPSDVPDTVWNDWLAHRKLKKAVVTNNVITKLRSEADKIGWTLEQVLVECCQRGWIGFNSEWVLNKQGVKNGYYNQNGTASTFDKTVATFELAKQMLDRENEMGPGDMGLSIDKITN